LPPSPRSRQSDPNHSGKRSRPTPYNAVIARYESQAPPRKRRRNYGIALALYFSIVRRGYAYHSRAPRVFFRSSVDHLAEALFVRLLIKAVVLGTGTKYRMLSGCAIAASRRKKLDSVASHRALFFATLARRPHSKKQFKAESLFPAHQARGVYQLPGWRLWGLSSLFKASNEPAS